MKTRGMAKTILLLFLVLLAPGAAAQSGANDRGKGAPVASTAFLERLAFQLYSSRNFPPLEAQLSVLAGLGYEAVEFGAGSGSAADMKELLDRHGLKSPSGHFDLELLRSDPASVVARAHLFGMDVVAIAYLPPEARPKDSEGWLALGRELQDFAELLGKHDLKLAWHTHDFEFEKLPDGSYPLDRMFEAAPSLFWQPDIGWLTRAGQDPYSWLERYLDRVRTVHLKDVAAEPDNGEGGWADIGYGTVDWTRLLPLLAGAEIGALIVEHDDPSDFVRFARRSRATVAAWPSTQAE